MALVIQRPSGSFIYFDLTMEEGHPIDAEVTDYPVEVGPNVTDNVRVKPDEFTCRCFVSNSNYQDPGGINGNRGGTMVNVTINMPDDSEPLGLNIGSLLGGAENAISNLISPRVTQYTVSLLQWPSGSDFVADTLHSLRAMIKAAELLQVTTSKYVYTDVVLKHAEMVRNAGTGDGAEFVLNFKQIILVNSQLGQTPTPTQPRGQAKTVKGAKAPTPAAPGPIASVAKHIGNAISGALP